MLLGRNQLRNWIAGTVRRERSVGVDDADFAVHGVDRDLKLVAQVPRPRCARNTIRAEYADVVWGIADHALGESVATILRARAPKNAPKRVSG